MLGEGASLRAGNGPPMPLFDPSSIFNTHEEYVIITKPEEVKEIAAAILKSKPEPILGVDCEGLAKGRPLCLLQVTLIGLILLDVLRREVLPFRPSGSGPLQLRSQRSHAV